MEPLQTLRASWCSPRDGPRDGQSVTVPEHRRAAAELPRPPTAGRSGELVAAYAARLDRLGTRGAAPTRRRPVLGGDPERRGAGRPARHASTWWPTCRAGPSTPSSACAPRATRCRSWPTPTRRPSGSSRTTTAWPWSSTPPRDAELALRAARASSGRPPSAFDGSGGWLPPDDRSSLDLRRPLVLTVFSELPDGPRSRARAPARPRRGGVQPPARPGGPCGGAAATTWGRPGVPGRCAGGLGPGPHLAARPLRLGRAARSAPAATSPPRPAGSGTMTARMHLGLDQAFGRAGATSPPGWRRSRRRCGRSTPTLLDRPDVVASLLGRPARLGQSGAPPSGPTATSTWDGWPGPTRAGWCIDFRPGGTPALDRRRGARPTGRCCRSPLADVADMLWSFHHVADVAATERDPSGTTGPERAGPGLGGPQPPGVPGRLPGARRGSAAWSRPGATWSAKLAAAFELERVGRPAGPAAPEPRLAAIGATPAGPYDAVDAHRGPHRRRRLPRAQRRDPGGGRSAGRRHGDECVGFLDGWRGVLEDHAVALDPDRCRDILHPGRHHPRARRGPTPSPPRTARAGAGHPRRPGRRRPGGHRRRRHPGGGRPPRSPSGSRWWGCPRPSTTTCRGPRSPSGSTPPCRSPPRPSTGCGPRPSPTTGSSSAR